MSRASQDYFEKDGYLFLFYFVMVFRRGDVPSQALCCVVNNN